MKSFTFFTFFFFIGFISFSQTVSGSGSINYIPKFTATSAIANSLIFDNGTNIGIGTTLPTAKLDILGNTANTNTVQFGNFGIQSSTNTNAIISQNMYWDGTTFRYRQTAPISLLQFVSGDILFGNAPSGTIGTATTLTYPLSIKQGALTNSLYINNVGIGIGTANPLSRLQIGDQTVVSTTTPDAISLGGSYSPTRGQI